MFCFCIASYSYSQTGGLTGSVTNEGAYDKWSAAKTATFSNGQKIEYRSMLSASSKGSKVTLEIKNLSDAKLKGMIVFAYDIPNVSTPMTGMEDFSVKAGETATTSYSAKFCGAKNNSYEDSYGCGHVFKIFAK